MESFNSHLNDFATNPTLDLLPSGIIKEMTEVNQWIYDGINDGVYRCGFAKLQKPYDAAFDSLFSALDRLEALLSSRRYICGREPTAADIRAFVTLVRFDEVYVVYFKCNKATIRNNYPNLFNFVKDVYQLPGVAKSVNMQHIKNHYYTSHPTLNTYAVVPKGNPDDFSTPHDRARFENAENK